MQNSNRLETILSKTLLHYQNHPKNVKTRTVRGTRIQPSSEKKPRAIIGMSLSIERFSFQFS